MYCILVTGIPAAGKSTLAKAVARSLGIPIISKDSLKELLFDHVGFRSREEKVKLGIASMEIMYAVAGQLMEAGQPFLLENNFECSSTEGLQALLERYRYPVLTLHLTGDYRAIHRRFLAREASPDRHRGHVVNDCYPERAGGRPEGQEAKALSYEDFVRGIKARGYDDFQVPGEQIRVDTTDFSKVDVDKLLGQIAAWREKKLSLSMEKCNFQD